MDKIFNYLVSSNTDLMMIIVFAFFFTLEQLVEKPFAIEKNLLHSLSGILLQAGYIVVNLATATAFVFCCDWIANNKVGLFNQAHIAYSLQILFGLLAIDFVAYWAHRVNHTLSIFWRLHRVHHSDTAMDSSTSLRAHPFDVLLDNASILVAAFIFGLDINILIIRWVIYMPLFFPHHSSINYPKWIDATFGKIFVTPNLHKIHHHKLQEYTDSNYGNMLIIWDKIFKTYKYIPIKEITYGLAEFEPKGRQSFWFLLISPFTNFKK